MNKIKCLISILAHLIFLFFILNVFAKEESKYSIWIENSLHKIKKDTKLQSTLLTSMVEIKLAKNEYEAFQLVLNAKSQRLKDVKITVTDLKGTKGGLIKKENIEIFLEHYIYILQFTDSPGWYPDALLPFEILDLEPYTVVPIWVSIYIPRHTITDEYEGSIIVKPSNAESFTIVLKVTVWDFSLPVTPYLKTSFGIQPAFIAERQGVPNAKLKDMVRKYNENALNHRVSPENLVYPDIIERDGNIFVDFKNFDIEMEHYLNLGLSSFNVFWHQFPPSGVKVSSAPLKEEKITNKTREILRITEEHLMEKDWLDLSYIYLIDEPRKEYFLQVKETFNFLRDCSPGIKRLLTLEYWAWSGILKPAYKELAGYVDIWCVLTSFYDEVFLRERQKRNDEVWWYVSCGSKHPYANFWAIDYPAIDHRIIFWQAWRYNITGFLYWAINYWKVDVWEDPVAYPETNGDGYLIYWNKDGPINSIRWEIIRDGIEDYDYFRILREASNRLLNKDKEKRYVDLINKAKKILDVSDLTPSLTNYTKEPQNLFDRREEIAKLIIEIKDILSTQ